VRQAEVSFRAKEARVVFDPSLVTVDDLVGAVNQLGFRASLKRGSE
jgi:copper chaperone CopZ